MEVVEAAQEASSPRRRNRRGAAAAAAAAEAEAEATPTPAPAPAPSPTRGASRQGGKKAQAQAQAPEAEETEAAAAAAEAAADVRRGRGGDHGDGGVHCDGDGDGDGGRPSIRKYVVGLVERQGEEGAGVVVAAYDACVDALVAFRRAHLSVVNVYILRQERGGADDASSLGQGAGLARAAGGKGTGGTGVLEFLAPLKEETEKARLAGRSK